MVAKETLEGIMGEIRKHTNDAFVGGVKLSLEKARRLGYKISEDDERKIMRSVYKSSIRNCIGCARNVLAKAGEDSKNNSSGARAYMNEARIKAREVGIFKRMDVYFQMGLLELGYGVNLHDNSH